MSEDNLRLPPEKREGMKYKTIIIPLETYHKIKELQKTQYVGMGAIIKPLIDKLFEDTYRLKNEAPNTNTPRRRYNV